MRKTEKSSKSMISATKTPAARLEALKRELGSSLSYRALEQRIAFDAAMADTFDAVALNAATTPGASQDHALPPVTVESVRDLATKLSEAVAEVRTQTPGGVIVFIDAAVNDPAVIAAAAPAGAEIVVLDRSRDGLAQIAQHLSARSGVDAIHIVSHGSDGELNLGSATINEQILSGHAADLASIKAALAGSADILLYGCDVAATTKGQSFVAHLAAATGADVAASTDDTGAAAKGGDWDLETRTGLIEAGLIDAPEWNGLLAPLTISATSAAVVRDNTDAFQILREFHRRRASTLGARGGFHSFCKSRQRLLDRQLGPGREHPARRRVRSPQTLDSG